MRVAILGATGPIGRRLTRSLLHRRVEVRVVSRSPGTLERDFGRLPVERHAADLEDAVAAVAAARGCDVVVHAVGLPPERFERHVPIALHVTAACRESGARPFLVTSYWSYGPGDAAPMPESRPQRPGSRMAEVRARQERIFLSVGGAVARLPDFYGPEPGVSVLNDALAAVRRGRAVKWPGDPEVRRDYLYHGDAGRLLAELLLRQEAYGEAWNVPGSGARATRSLLEEAARLSGTRLNVQRIRLWMARLVGLVRADVRAAADLIPLYEAPAILDTTKLERLLGAVETTPYERSLPATLAWLDRA